MSYNRKMRDRQKVNNYTAKHDFNRGGFHGKPEKAKRHAVRQIIHQHTAGINTVTQVINAPHLEQLYYE